MIFSRYCSFSRREGFPFGVIVKSHARTARERTRQCEGRSLAARLAKIGEHAGRQLFFEIVDNYRIYLV